MGDAIKTGCCVMEQNCSLLKSQGWCLGKQNLKGAMRLITTSASRSLDHFIHSSLFFSSFVFACSLLHVHIPCFNVPDVLFRLRAHGPPYLSFILQLYSCYVHEMATA